MTDLTRDVLGLGGWLAGWLVTARLLFVWLERNDDGDGDGDPFIPVVVGLIWPVLLGIGIVLLPFLGVGWLISRPVRARRRD